MDDDNAESKLSKLAPPEDDDAQLLRVEEWYQPGSGAAYRQDQRHHVK